ncbi:MAG: hypothetical protein KJO91_03685, partial [Gammaproteobacteria bacterium]|nr:hypothetical protein [Gammaproteobacteria bacterium]
RTDALVGSMCKTGQEEQGRDKYLQHLHVLNHIDLLIIVNRLLWKNEIYQCLVNENENQTHRDSS